MQYHWKQFNTSHQFNKYMMLIGKTKIEGINYIQDKISSPVSRVFAENVFFDLIENGIIAQNKDGFMLMEELTDEDLHRRGIAKEIKRTNAVMQRRRSVSTMRQKHRTQKNQKRTMLKSLNSIDGVDEDGSVSR